MDNKYVLVNPVSSSENVRNPLFISLVRGANILAVAAFGLSEQICFFLKTLAVAVTVVVVVGLGTTTFGFGSFGSGRPTGPSPAGNKNAVKSTRHLGLNTFTVEFFTVVIAPAAAAATTGCRNG